MRDRSPIFAGIRPFFHFSGIIAGRWRGCWYRDFRGIEPMQVKNDTYFRHLKPSEKDYKRSDSGGLFMLVTTTGSKLWRFGYRFDAKQKLLALGQYPVTSLADARIKRDDAKKLLAEGFRIWRADGLGQSSSRRLGGRHACARADRASAPGRRSDRNTPGRPQGRTPERAYRAGEYF